MIFTVKKAMLERFLKLCTLKGTLPDGTKEELIDAFSIVAKNDELSMRMPDRTKAVFVEVVLSPGAGSKLAIKDAGTLPIGDVDEFSKFLARMGKVVTIRFDGKTIVMEDGNKKAEFQATYEDMVVPDVNLLKKNEAGMYVLGIDEKPFETKFEVQVESLQEVTKDGDLVGVREYPLQASSDGLKIAVGEPQTAKITNHLELYDFKGAPMTAVYAHGFDNVVNNVEGMVSFYMIEKGPCIIETNMNDYEFRAMIAPRLER